MALLAVALVLTGCTGTSTDQPASSGPGEGASRSVTPAVTGNTCPQVMDASEADFYPIQPSFSAGYSAAAQKLDDSTRDWAYVLTGDFPYSYWMAWYLYTTDGVPLVKLSDTAITADQGSTNPFVTGNPILAEPRSYRITFMPADTPSTVVDQMESDGQNVVLLPEPGSTPGVSLVWRSYWSLANDGLGDYDRWGYGGPTDTPVHTIQAFLTDSATGELTDTPVDDCGAQSQLPQRLWYNPASNSPVITFQDAPVPSEQDVADLPHFLLQTGSMGGGTAGKEFPPSPDPQQVQFYRDVAANAPYADVQSAPPAGNPPDACGGYVFANLPNDVVSLVHIPQIPSFPDYQGATSQTKNDTSSFNLAFYSVVIYGAEKQVDAVGQVQNSQIGNRQINGNDDGSVTVVLYPRSATDAQVAQIDAVVKANGWNILRSGVQSAIAPNLLVIREKGQNDTWKNAISANSVTQGAPCPQSSDPDLLLPQDPPSAQVTQFNGMGLTAPQGQNCSIEEFLSGACLKALGEQLSLQGAVWSASSTEPPAQRSP